MHGHRKFRVEQRFLHCHASCSARLLCAHALCQHQGRESNLARGLATNCCKLLLCLPAGNALSQARAPCVLRTSSRSSCDYASPTGRQGSHRLARGGSRLEVHNGKASALVLALTSENADKVHSTGNEVSNIALCANHPHPRFASFSSSFNISTLSITLRWLSQLAH